MNMTWSALSPEHLTQIAGLAGRCTARDGGEQEAWGDLLGRRYGLDMISVGVFGEDRLLAAGCVRLVACARASAKT